MFCVQLAAFDAKGRDGSDALLEYMQNEYTQNIMSKSSAATIPANFVPLRAPQRWFMCIEYAPGLKVELPYADEAIAIAAGIAHVKSGQNGVAKIGYYGFRSRVIVYAAAELNVLDSE